MTIVFAIPSKGRLKNSSELLLAQAGLKLARAGAERGYRGHLEAIDDVEVAFISATEIAKSLRDGIVDCGITGEDVLREAVPAEVETIAIPLRLPFGNANVVVAVPESWLDVAGVADLDDVSVGFYERHGRRMRVATKYKYLTRRFFAERASPVIVSLKAPGLLKARLLPAAPRSLWISLPPARHLPPTISRSSTTASS